MSAPATVKNVPGGCFPQATVLLCCFCPLWIVILTYSSLTAHTWDRLRDLHRLKILRGSCAWAECHDRCSGWSRFLLHSSLRYEQWLWPPLVPPLGRNDCHPTYWSCKPGGRAILLWRGQDEPLLSLCQSCLYSIWCVLVSFRELAGELGLLSGWSALFFSPPPPHLVGTSTSCALQGEVYGGAREAPLCCSLELCQQQIPVNVFGSACCVPCVYLLLAGIGVEGGSDGWISVPWTFSTKYKISSSLDSAHARCEMLDKLLP